MYIRIAIVCLLRRAKVTGLSLRCAGSQGLNLGFVFFHSFLERILCLSAISYRLTPLGSLRVGTTLSTGLLRYFIEDCEKDDFHPTT